MTKKNTANSIVVTIAVITLIVISVFGIWIYYNGSGLATSSYEKSNEGKKLNIVTSILPLYLITQGVFGDEATVSLLAQGNVDPHSFEPTAQDIRDVLVSDIFIYNGGVDSWADAIAGQASQSKVQVLKLADIAPIQLENTEKEAHDVDEKHEEEEHADYDPHLWLNLQNSSTLVTELETIADNRSISFNKDYNQELQALDQEYGDRLSQCSFDTIVVSHNAFGYLGERYNFQINSIAGLEPSDEPSPAQLAQIITDINADSLTTLLIESQANQAIAEQIAGQTNTQIKTIYSLESGDSTTSYLDYMKQNLDAIAQARQCD
jgi:zinc transport system substrate-binding protein